MTVPRIGDLCVARAPGALSRMVLIMDHSPDEDVSVVALVTNEIEFATAEDVRLDVADTGLPYPLLVETDVVAALWDSQLDNALGHVEDEPLSHAMADPMRRGLPYATGGDTRLAWKRSEDDDLRALASERMAAVAGENEEASFGPAQLATAWETAVAEGVSVSVDAFDPERPSLFRWHVEHPGARELAERLAAVGQESLRALAVADMRLSVHAAPMWEIDRGLAALDVAEIIDDDFRFVLDLYIERAIAAILRLSSVFEWLDAASVSGWLDDLEPLAPHMTADERRAFTAIRERVRAWTAVDDYDTVLLDRRGRGGQRVIPVFPDLAVHGLVQTDEQDGDAESGSLGLLSLEPGEDSATASVWLSPRTSAVVREWERVRELADDNPDRRRAEVLWEAVTGGVKPVTVWLQVIDQVTGEALESFRVDKVADSGEPGRLVELRGEVPAELLDDQRSTAVFVSGRPNRPLDAQSLTAYLLVTSVVAPEATVAFARNLRGEIPSGPVHDVAVAAEALAGRTAATVGEQVLAALAEARDMWCNHVGSRLVAAERAGDRQAAAELVVDETKQVVAALRRIHGLLP